MYRVIIFLLWIVSVWSIIYADYYRAPLPWNTHIESSLKKINEFSEFYSIHLKKPFWNKELIWYKQEQLEKLMNSYKYTIIMKLSTDNFSFWLNFFDIKWEVFLDESWVIENFRVLVQNDFLIKWERDWNNILVRYWKSDDINLGKWQSKSYSLKDFNFDFLFIKSLPYSEFELNKSYVINYLMPSQLVGNWINQSSISLKKTDDFNYTISQKIWNFNIDTFITFNENKELIKEENVLMSFNLIKDKNQRNTVLNKIDKINAPSSNNNWLTWNNLKQSNGTWVLQTWSTEKLDISKMIDRASTESTAKSCDLLER